MNKKPLALLVLCLLSIAGTAAALETDSLVAVTAMPLAVADVVALPNVPVDPFMDVVTTLNRAEVPAPQFVEIVRYAPVALVEPANPPFATYVTQQYQSGVVGEPLALAIAHQYDAYGIQDVNVVQPPVVTTVVEQQILPPVVVTRFQPAEFDPLAVVAMPLAVAAVADAIDVPRTDLMQFVASLNQAMVPAPQFVEVVRYSPVVLADPSVSPQFVQFVTTEVDRGVVGTPLAFAIANRLQTVDRVDVDLVRPQRVLVTDQDVILPPVVTALPRAHPHGGPPGQLKKELGLQTGAEVVHGTMPSARARVRTERVIGRTVNARPRVVERRVVERRHAAPKIRTVKPREQHRVIVSPARPAPPAMRPGRGPAMGMGMGRGHGGGGGQPGNAGGGGKGKGRKKG